MAARSPGATLARQVRIRPIVLIRALAKRFWATRGRLVVRRLPWAVGLLIGLLIVREFFAVGIVVSPSVKPVLVVLRRGAPVQIGSLAAYRYSGLPRGDYRRGDEMIHWVIAGEGSVVTVEGRTVFVDGKAVGVAKESTYRLETMTPIAAGVVPKDSYYVMGTHAGALDSRYAEAGFVHKSDVIGRAWVVF